MRCLIYCNIDNYMPHICYQYAIIKNIKKHHLLSDAERAEDGVEDFGGGDFAGDGGKVGEGFAQVLGGEISFEPVL